jgi:NDP-sugar pyrophosphorylase family protein
MKAMLFAAGLGTRLKPLTDTMPKALVPLAGKTLLQWQVDKLRDAGITDIVVNVHHFPDMIIDAIRANKGWGCRITVSDERNCLLDTGGGLRKMYNAQGTMHNEAILACNVDILSDIDIKDLIRRYEQTGVSQLVVSERTTQRYLCFDENGLMQGWTNIATGELKGKDGRHWAFSGMQLLNEDVLAHLQHMPEDKFSMIDFYLSICAKNAAADPRQRTPLMAYVPNNYHMMDVGKINQIEEAEKFAEQLNHSD